MATVARRKKQPVKHFGYGIQCFSKSRSGKALGNPRRKLSPSTRTRLAREADCSEWSNRRLAFSALREALEPEKPMFYINANGETVKTDYRHCEVRVLVNALNVDGDSYWDTVDAETKALYDWAVRVSNER